MYTPRPRIIHTFGKWAMVIGRSGFKGQVLKLGSSSLCLVYLGTSVLNLIIPLVSELPFESE